MRRSSVRRADVDSIYEQCMERGQEYRVTARDVSLAHESPFALHCEYHVDRSEMDPDDAFNELLRERGIAHETKTKAARYPNTMLIESKTPEEGFAKALDAMAIGVDSLDNPDIIYLPEGMHGRPDVLVKCNGVSALGGYHYEVVEIKLAKTPEKKHILQAAFYNRMVGFVQGYTPERFFVIGGDGVEHAYDYAKYADLLDEMVALARRIRGGYVPPPIYGEKGISWIAYSNKEAIESDSVTLVTGIGMGTVRKLEDAGITTTHDVAACTEADLASVKGIKTDAPKFIASARAITSGKVVRVGGQIDLPERSTEIFIDLEGMGPLADESIHDYLIGVWIRGNNDGGYKPFIAEDKREDVMLESFVKFMDKQSDYVMYHWHSYECTYLRKMMERHGIDAYHLLEPDVLVDLLKISRETFAFPKYSNSLKDVAKWMGFEWQHADVGALTSIDLYLKYVENPAKNMDSMQKVLDYNRDDCEATRVVKDWMMDNSENLLKN